MFKQKLFLFSLLLLFALALVVGATVLAGSAGQGAKDIGAAAIASLEEIGWDVEGFTAEMEAVAGDYARVRIDSVNPPGGFTAYVQKQDDDWEVIAHGSAFNPEELKALGIPDGILP